MLWAVGCVMMASEKKTISLHNEASRCMVNALGAWAETMAKIRILISLTTNDNDYQIEQAQSAGQAASKLGVSAEIIYANNDAINQSTQILRAIQASSAERPNAIVFEPVGGTALPQVARAAAAAEIGWAVLNRDASYIEDLRKNSTAP